jgi:predicted ATPase
MRSLIVNLWLKENENKKSIIESLKLNQIGPVIAEFIPEIELLIGKQKELENLEKSEEIQKRTFNAFMKFLTCFACGHVLILTIDDLQWADSGSLIFLQHLSKTTEKIFVIGAYRDNEVDSKHPLAMTIENFDSIAKISLSNLEIEDLNAMVSDTLDIDPKNTLVLSELIFKKTAGNPFFSREFFDNLYQEEKIVLKDGEWIWDVNEIEKMDYSSNAKRISKFVEYCCLHWKYFHQRRFTIPFQ